VLAMYIKNHLSPLDKLKNMRELATVLHINRTIWKSQGFAVLESWLDDDVNNLISEASMEVIGKAHYPYVENFSDMLHDEAGLDIFRRRQEKFVAWLDAMIEHLEPILEDHQSFENDLVMQDYHFGMK